ncbi:MAG: hypothetical protein O3B47_01635 [bacterium]|nr:hypothetical protein [bacterium]
MPDQPVLTPLQIAKAKVADLSVEKRWSMSCYIPIVNIITCVLTSVRMNGSKFCNFHARQGLALFGLWFLTILIALVSPTLSLMLWGVVLLLHITGMVIVAQGKETKIPLLGQLAMKIPENHIYMVLTGKVPEAKVVPPQPGSTQPPKTQIPPANPMNSEEKSNQ